MKVFFRSVHKDAHEKVISSGVGHTEQEAKEADGVAFADFFESWPHKRDTFIQRVSEIDLGQLTPEELKKLEGKA